MLVDSLKFNNGPRGLHDDCLLRPGSVTIFIGPNNGGKSSALREISNEFNFNGSTDRHIFSEIKINEITRELAEKKISRYRSNESEKDSEKGIFFRRGMGRQEVNERLLFGILLEKFNKGEEFGVNEKEYFCHHFMSSYIINLSGESRLGLVNQGQGQRLDEPALSTIAALFKDDDLRKKLSDIVFDSFGMHLVIDATNMSGFFYALSEERPEKQIERSFSDEAIAFFKKSQNLSRASDGTKAFIGVMSEVLAGDAEVIIVDEPEAFLHPGLAYKLGREICLNIGEGKQFFAATHSPHFLMGCLSTGMSINIVRLTHHAGKGTTRLLPASELSQMMNDPLLRSVGVVSALFYEAAIITEADADRAFYEEINNRLNLYSKNGVNHALFLNAHNKQTAAEIAFQLRKVGVPAAIILDLDWIKEDGQVCKKYLDSAGIPESIRDGFRSIRKNIRDRLNLKDPNYKRNGGINILEGNEFISAEYFFDQMDDYGLFTVRLGELEQWLKYLNCSKNKSLWLSEIFSSIGSDPTSPNYLKPQNGDV